MTDGSPNPSTAEMIPTVLPTESRSMVVEYIHSHHKEPEPSGVMNSGPFFCSICTPPTRRNTSTGMVEIRSARRR